MAAIKISRKQRLIATIAISFTFFLVEIVAGFYTHSLALVADAFHYLSDLIGFVVALTALMLSERSQPPPRVYTFGWQRATLLGAFFNGVFLLALGVSILVQAIERFSNIHDIEKPKLVLIIGCVGLGLNVLALSFLHEHDHDHCHSHGHSHSHDHAVEHDHIPTTTECKTSTNVTEGRPTSPLSIHHEHKHTIAAPVKAERDFGMLGVLIHVIGDALNNIGVIISALIIWRLKGEGRYYADPAVGVFIAFMVFLTAIPLVKKSGSILLQIAPEGIDLGDVKHDIELIPGVISVHELHIWRLDQQKSIASAHIVVDSESVDGFTKQAKVIMECLHDYGIHSVTLQPEIDTRQPLQFLSTETQSVSSGDTALRQRSEQSSCQLICGELCGKMQCCTPPI